MKSTKKMLITAMAVGILIAGGYSLRAQDSTNASPATVHGTKGHGNLAKELDLTDAQKTKFQEITKDLAEKRKALREDASLTTEERKAKNKALQEETATQMKALLTPEQFTKWEATIKKSRHNNPPADSKAASPS